MGLGFGSGFMGLGFRVEGPGLPGFLLRGVFVVEGFSG